jgi:hypothetical protein
MRPTTYPANLLPSGVELVQEYSDARSKERLIFKQRTCPYSTADRLAKIDQRTREGRLTRETRAELIAHVGDQPSATQRALIEQLVQIRLRLALMDRKFAETGGQTDHDSRTYLAWANSYARLLRQLGPRGHKAGGASLADYLAAKAATQPTSGNGASTSDVLLTGTAGYTAAQTNAVQ